MKVNNYTKNKFDNKSDNIENHFREFTKMVKTSTKVTDYTESIFDNIRHTDKNDTEYWSARELMPILGYKRWENFYKVIKQAMISCENSEYMVKNHFRELTKMVNIGSKTSRLIDDYKLSRYACYLIAQNGDAKKKSIALAQTYFAVQTRKIEILEKEYLALTEDEKRLCKRNMTKKGNLSLNQAAKQAGVKNFDKFHNAGYKGLYNGETANDIAKRKGLRYREDILDNMGSEELGANIFRITQAEAKLKRENIKLESEANKAHYEVGKVVRNSIKIMGGTMPENLPTPSKSLKELEKTQKNKFQN